MKGLLKRTVISAGGILFAITSAEMPLSLFPPTSVQAETDEFEEGEFVECDGIWYKIFEDHAAIVCYGGPLEGEIIIPDKYNDLPITIGEFAFAGWDKLTSITIPECITSIDDYAFSDCRNLTDITISDGVTSIGNYAFRWCNALTNITIPDSVTSIGECAFFRLQQLNKHYNSGKCHKH